MSDEALARSAQASFFGSGANAEKATVARQSMVHDELESVCSGKGWKTRWKSDEGKRRRVIEARLRRTPALGPEVPLPPSESARDYPTAFEIYWCWGEATVLFHSEIQRVLATATKPGATSLDAAPKGWKAALGGFSRTAALDASRSGWDTRASLSLQRAS